MIGLFVGCSFVCVFVDTKTSSLSETGQFMSSTYYVPVRNRASTYLTNESVRQGAKKSKLLKFSALLKLLFNINCRPLPEKQLLPEEAIVILADLWLCLLVLAVNWNNN